MYAVEYKKDLVVNYSNLFLQFSLFVFTQSVVQMEVVSHKSNYRNNEHAQMVFRKCEYTII